MGGCVASALSFQNSRSVIPHPGIEANKQWLSEPYNVRCTEPGEHDSGIYRARETKHLDAAGLKKEYYYGNLCHKMRECCKKYGNRTAAGVRPLEKIEKTTIEDSKGRKKPWSYYCYKPTIKYSYTQFWEMIVQLGQGFKEIGIKAGDRVGIYEDTRMEWMVTCYGLWTIGATGVTVYANLGQDALAYAIKESELKFIVCNGGLAGNFKSICETSGVEPPFIIHIDEVPTTAQAQLDKDRIISWNDVLEKGKKIVPSVDNNNNNNNNKNVPPVYDIQPDDIALIMYTSGTTGDPKGVVMSHGNLNSAIGALRHRLANFAAEDGSEKTYVAYLPLAHILEFCAETVMLHRGCYVGFGNSRTLTNTAAKPHGDLQEFRPLFFIGVPRVFDTIKKVIEERIPAGVQRRVFHKAFEERWQCLKEGKDTPFYNSKVFTKVREVLGGRCEAMLSGGAPISSKTQQFITVVSGASFVQGYGLTENCCSTATQLSWDIHFQEVGAILPCSEVKLRDTGDWTHKHDPPQGEIMVRGPAVTQGYYRQPERTREAFGEDGWFATGDVGEFTKDLNNLKIVGRVKALAKTAHGEYIALETIESICVLNDLCLPNGVCVLVDSQKSFICALVLTDEKKATKFAQENKIAGSWPDLLKNPEFHAAAAESLAETLKKNGRKPFECVKKVRVLDDEWTPENGILTAAQKLKRREVDKQYANVIKELFDEGDASSF